jgi:hypothetical protein
MFVRCTPTPRKKGKKETDAMKPKVKVREGGSGEVGIGRHLSRIFTLFPALVLHFFVFNVRFFYPKCERSTVKIGVLSPT